ncbi:hypothetical protein LUZ61_016945 [Rhynchospora tenuis]|uniref:SAP domain-containing protein n=1 Tax=Rhynchospora tenuis TaxID=198213 RepID=A0AAD6EKI7_9POAL|nr:hypothetical protein LUZ61_016945 [Rhynchospora tenuis]
MSYKEAYEAYINLSRKELQGLCKKHNLPANKCQSDLAKSLASYFKKKNASLVNNRKASSAPAKGIMEEKTNDKDHSEDQHDKRLDAEVGNELREASTVFIESAKEDNEEAVDGTVDGIIDHLNSTSTDVLRNQNLISQSPEKREEEALPLEPSSDNLPLEPSSDNLILKSQSPSKSQNQEPHPQCTCDEKSSIGLAAESSTIAETSARPASFQFFVTSEEGINLFVDLNSGPSDWVQSFNDEICTNPLTQSGSISSFVKCANSSLGSLSENLQSESVPLESPHNLSDLPTQIENGSGGIQEEEEQNEEREFCETVKEDTKEACEISVSADLLVPCQNGVELAGDETDPLAEEVSVVGPTDKVVILDSATADSLLSSSDALDDISVLKASDSPGLTLDKNLKRALNLGSEEASPNKKLHVVQESNKGRDFAKILRSWKTLVKEAVKDNVSVLRRRSTRLVSKVSYPSVLLGVNFFFLFCILSKVLRYTKIYFCTTTECQHIHHGPLGIVQEILSYPSFV